MAHQSEINRAYVTSFSPENKVDEKEKEKEQEVDYNSLEESLKS